METMENLENMKLENIRKIRSRGTCEKYDIGK